MEAIWMIAFICRRQCCRWALYSISRCHTTTCASHRILIYFHQSEHNWFSSCHNHRLKRHWDLSEGDLRSSLHISRPLPFKTVPDWNIKFPAALQLKWASLLKWSFKSWRALVLNQLPIILISVNNNLSILIEQSGAHCFLKVFKKPLYGLAVCSLKSSEKWVYCLAILAYFFLTGNTLVLCYLILLKKTTNIVRTAFDQDVKLERKATLIRRLWLQISSLVVILGRTF